jgi:hypothetical protein
VLPESSLSFPLSSTPKAPESSLEFAARGVPQFVPRVFTFMMLLFVSTFPVYFSKSDPEPALPTALLEALEFRTVLRSPVMLMPA